VRPSIGSQTIGSRRSQVRIKKFAHRCLDCANAVVEWGVHSAKAGCTGGRRASFSVSIDKQGIRLHSLKGFQDSH
jgi:hypothetical protein